MQYLRKWISERKIDEHETSKNANNNQQTVTQKVTNTNNETTTQRIPENQTEDTNDVAPSSPDFPNLTTDVGDNPYIRRPPPIESPPIPRDHRLQSVDKIREK